MKSSSAGPACPDSVCSRRSVPCEKYTLNRNTLEIGERKKAIRHLACVYSISLCLTTPQIPLEFHGGVRPTDRPFDTHTLPVRRLSAFLRGSKDTAGPAGRKVIFFKEG